MSRYKRNRSKEFGATLTEFGVLTAGIAVVSVLALTNAGISSSEPLCDASNTIERNGSTVQQAYSYIPGAGCFAHCDFGYPQQGQCCGMTPYHYCPPLNP